MPDADPFDPGRWEMTANPGQASEPAPAKHRRHRRADRFLKGPVPWPWLVRAMGLPGKALAVGLMLSIGLMGIAASMIAKILNRYPWISYAGLFIVLFVAIKMIWEGGWMLMEAVPL